MISLQWLLFLLVIPEREGAKILVTAPFPGSHYFALSDIGHLLAKQGHDITFVSLRIDDRHTIQHENFKLITPFWEILTATEFDDILYECVNDVINSERDEFMYTDTMVSNELCRKSWKRLYRMFIDYYSSDQFLALIEKEKFDLIIAEERTALPILAVTNDGDIPLAAYIPEVEYSKTREVQNLPMFLCSEPGLAIQVFNGEKPGFWKRLYAMYNLVSGGAILENAIEDMLQPTYEKHGVKSTQSLNERIQLFIVNDHPAFSFPYQVANNVVQVGGSSLKEGQPLQGDIKEFVEKQTGPIVLVSMGTYTDLTWLKWHTTLLEVLEESNFSVILKVHKETQHKLPALSTKFYLSSWIPQRNLLASGVIKLFISHCGNNGKIETIYYQVPVLCTPVFAEQALNGESVQYRGFGEMILPSEMTKKHLNHILNKMTEENESYRAEMSKAVDIYTTEPADGKEKLLYYLNLLIKYRNLDYLVNEVIKQQNVLEIYHLDILGFVLLITLFVSYVLFRIVYFGFVMFFRRSHFKHD